ncbi:hypothetical protein [Helicobacter sp. 23-1045]
MNLQNFVSICHMVASLRSQILRIERSEISQILPLPCGGGLRGWVRIPKKLPSLRDLPLANRGNPQKKYLVFSTIRTKFAESNAPLQTIEAFAVWLCTKFVPLLGNRTNGSLTTQWGKLRVNCIPKGKLPKQTNAQLQRIT